LTLLRVLHFYANISNRRPLQLYNSLSFETDRIKHYNLRSNALLTTQSTRTNGDLTFSYFFTKFINSVLYDDIFIDSKLFNVRFDNNDISGVHYFFDDVFCNIFSTANKS